MSPRSSAAPLRAFAPIFLLALLTVAFTWPAALYLTTHVVDRQDPLLNAWIMAWEAHQLLRDPLHLFQANIFHPYPAALAFSEILLSTTALILPVRWAGASPILSYNIAFLLAFFTSALGVYLFALELTGRRLAALVAGAAFAFSPYRMGHLSQVQLLAAGWLPLALLYLDRLLRGRGSLRRNTALFAFFLLLQALASFYAALFAAFAAGLYSAGFWLLRREGPRAGWTVPARQIVALIVAAGLIGLALLPFAVPYLQAQRELGAGWTLADNETFSASLQAYAYAPPETRLWGPLTRGLAYTYGPCCPPDTLFPGLTLLALAGLALWRGRGWRRWLLAGLSVAAFLLSLGPTLHIEAGRSTGISLPYGWLFEHVPGFNALRAPVRWASLVTLGLSLLAAMGVARFRRAPVIAPLLALVLVLVEFAVVPLRLVPAPEAHPVAEWLARRPSTRIVELPLAAELPVAATPPEQPRRAWEVSRLLEHQIASTLHWHTTPDGYSGYIPARHGDFAREMRGFPNERSLVLLRGLGIEYVVLHTRDLAPDRLAAITERLPGAPLGQVAEVEDALVFEVAPAPAPPPLGWSLLAPPTVTSGAPFTIWIVARADGITMGPVLPLDVTVAWDGESVEEASVIPPLVVEEVGTAPLAVKAPREGGEHRLTVRIPGETPLEAMVTVVEEEETPLAPFPVPTRLERATFPATVSPGQAPAITLAWRPLQPLDHYASVSLRLVGADGRVIAQRDGPPGGESATLVWEPGRPYEATWTLEVPREAAPGDYVLQVFWYDPTSGRRGLLWNGQNWVEGVTVGEVLLTAPQ